MLSKDSESNSLELEKQSIQDGIDYEDGELEIPLEIHVGFYSNISKKKIRQHVLAYAEKNFSSLNDVYYQIIEHEDGFLFEVHQGGSQLGYLQDYINNNYDDALIVASENIYRVTPSIHGGVRLVKLTDEDVKDVSANPDNFEILEGAGKLKKLKATGYGFYIFSLVFLFSSILFLGVSASVKYLVLDKTEAIYFTNMNKTYPHEFIREINNEMYQMDMSSEFFKNFTYDSSMKGEKKWEINKGSILGTEGVNEMGETNGMEAF
jgi:hypothetical protein